MRRLQCVLFGALWAAMYLLLASAVLIACLTVVPYAITGTPSVGAHITVNPMSLARLNPFAAAGVLAIVIGLPIFGFVRGYRCWARRILSARLA